MPLARCVRSAAQTQNLNARELTFLIHQMAGVANVVYQEPQHYRN